MTRDDMIADVNAKVSQWLDELAEEAACYRVVQTPDGTVEIEQRIERSTLFELTLVLEVGEDSRGGR